LVHARRMFFPGSSANSPTACNKTECFDRVALPKPHQSDCSKQSGRRPALLVNR
jgi:hypothetical protein